MNGKRSNYDQLFSTGRRCFYVDPCEDHRIDHFYPWESFFSGFPSSIYVWCRDQLLRTHQKFIIFFLAALLFTFPVYAEDERYEFQSIQNEALYLQGYDLNEYYSSIQEIVAFHPAFDNDNSEYVMRVFFKLSNSDLINSVRINRTTSANNSGWLNSSFTENDTYVNYPEYAGYYSNGVASKLPWTLNRVEITFNNGSKQTINVNESFTDDKFVNGKYIIQYIGGKMTAYLEQVATVFTWILTHITELITFILGNPFLAVSLVLFMCGAVISFYVRIKNS